MVLLSFIDVATACMDQTDETIEAEIAGLADRYRVSGMPGLSDSISQRLARNPHGAAVYVLADANFRPLLWYSDRWPTCRARTATGSTSRCPTVPGAPAPPRLTTRAHGTSCCRASTTCEDATLRAEAEAA